MGPQQMFVVGGGVGFLESYRPNQPSDEERRGVESLCIVCFGVRKAAQLFAAGCLP